MGLHNLFGGHDLEKKYLRSAVTPSAKRITTSRQIAPMAPLTAGVILIGFCIRRALPHPIVASSGNVSKSQYENAESCPVTIAPPMTTMMLPAIN